MIFDFKKFYEKQKKKYILFKLYSKLNKIFADINFDKVVKLKKLIEKSKKNKILVFGNGAGAAIASHFANDLSNTAKIKTLSFDNSAHLTCFANDYGYENWVKETIGNFC